MTFCATVICYFAANELKADLAYSVGTSSVSTTFTAAAGVTLSVPITVREYGQTAEISNGGGLFSAGFRVTQLSTPASWDSLIVQVTRSSLFDATNAGSGYSGSLAALSVDQSAGIQTEPAFPSGGQLLIGTLILQTAEMPGSTTYVISDFDASAGSIQFVTYDAVELDDVVNAVSPVTFTVVTAVPEPFAVSSALVGLMLLFRYRSTRAGR